MRTIRLTLGFLFLMCSFAYGQKKDTMAIHKKENKILFQSVSDKAENKFESDLKLKKLTVYLLGGIVSVIKKEDLEFEKHYKIHYHDFGCTAPMDFEFYERYNLLVFDFLSREHGKDWIASANRNAFGFKKWKEK